VRRPDDLPALSPLLFWSFVASTVGVFTFSSVRILALGRPTVHALSDVRQLQLLAIEAVMAGVWVPILSRRGWSIGGLTAPLRPLDVPMGAGLCLIALVAYVLTFYAVAVLSPAFARAAAAVQIGGSVSWWSVALVSIANPVAEELIYLGVIQNVAGRRGVGAAVLASVSARLAVHLYQGPLSVISIVPAGLAFAWYYAATRRLWPVVIAHSLMDALALGRLAALSG
jgi:uncharacterized protein